MFKEEIGTAATYEMLAEECSELAQACLKYARILRGEDISTMPIEYAPQFTKKYNPAICTELDITIPEGYEAIQ